MREERQLKDLLISTKKSVKKDFSTMQTRKEKVKHTILTVDYIVILSSKIIESSILRSIERGIKECGVNAPSTDYFYKEIAGKRFKGKSYKERINYTKSKFKTIVKSSYKEKDFDLFAYSMIITNGNPVGGTLFRHLRRLLLGESHRAKYQTKQIIATLSNSTVTYLPGHSSHQHLEGVYSPEDIPEFDNPYCTCELKLNKNKER